MCAGIISGRGTLPDGTPDVGSYLEEGGEHTYFDLENEKEFDE
jgi:hypothetical protein